MAAVRETRASAAVTPAARNRRLNRSSRAIFQRQLPGEDAPVQVLEQTRMQPFELLELECQKRGVGAVDVGQRFPRTGPMIEQGVVEIEEDGPQHSWPNPNIGLERGSLID